ncbi:PA2779 family protein [Noviherbaspirillum sp. ST9]|uniref:PA2779 family protein n=1 Tax=Noviherbaspirillum sp. ST9 TaxID=3401606 RepID=UPI003B58AA9E
MIQKLKQLFVSFVIVSFTFVGFTQSVQAAMVSTEQAAAAHTSQQNRERLAAALDRPDVAAQLEKMGVDKTEAQARVAAMNDEEVAAMAGRIDSLPAGGDILGAIVFVFVLLLVTDILGLTKVYPFTRSVR